MKQSAIIAAIIMLVAAACGHDSRLDRADALMYPQPDKALALLDSIDPATLSGEADRARYALLYSQAQNKNNIYPASDSLIDIAVDYYDRSGHDSLRMLAHFYRSAIRNSAAAYHAALRDGLMAKDIAEQLDMPYWVARASQEIADAYYQSYDMDNAIKYSDIAARDFNRTGYHLNAQYVILDKAVALSHRGRYAESLRILDSMTNVVDTTDYNIYAYVEKAYVRPLIYTHREKEALYHCKKNLLLLGDDDEGIFNYDDLANIYLKLHIPDSAALYFDNIRKTNIADFHLYKSAYHELKSDFPSALSELQTHLSIKNRQYNALINNSISSEEKEFVINKSKAESQAIKRKHYIIISILALAITFIVIVLVYNIYTDRKRRQRMELRLTDATEMIEELASLNQSLTEQLFKSDEMINNNTATTTQYQHIIEQLFKKEFIAISTLCDNYYIQPIKNNAAEKITKQIEDHLSYIVSDESLNNMQEIINHYSNGKLSKLSELIVLKKEDLTLLTLIIAGFTPKAICVLLDMRAPTFYTKRRRLKECLVLKNLD